MLINLIIKSPKTICTKLYLKKRYKNVEKWWNKLKYNFTSHEAIFFKKTTEVSPPLFCNSSITFGQLKSYSIAKQLANLKTIIKKIVETSDAEMLKLVYQNRYTKFIIYIRQSVDKLIYESLIQCLNVDTLSNQYWKSHAWVIKFDIPGILIYQVCHKCIFRDTKFIKNMSQSASIHIRRV